LVESIVLGEVVVVADCKSVVISTVVLVSVVVSVTVASDADDVMKSVVDMSTAAMTIAAAMAVCERALPETDDRFAMQLPPVARVALLNPSCLICLLFISGNYESISSYTAGDTTSFVRATFAFR
jgi:hypothetical protein